MCIRDSLKYDGIMYESILQDETSVDLGGRRIIKKTNREV
ncbi:hypothetical protein JMUB7512_27830 [Staphylococcus aureus]